jgi:hypothetical protein
MGRENFQVGDVVCTLSLDCEATVLIVEAGKDCEGLHHSCEPNSILCGWWDEVGERHSEWYKVENLRLVKRSTSNKALPIRRRTNLGYW